MTAASAFSAALDPEAVSIAPAAPEYTASELAALARAARAAVKRGTDAREAFAPVIDAHAAYLKCPNAPDRQWVRQHQHVLYALIGADA